MNDQGIGTVNAEAVFSSPRLGHSPARSDPGGLETKSGNRPPFTDQVLIRGAFSSLTAETWLQGEVMIERRTLT